MFGKSNLTNDEKRIRKYDYSVRVGGICLLLLVILVAMSQCTQREINVTSAPVSVIEEDTEIIMPEEIVVKNEVTEMP